MTLRSIRSGKPAGRHVWPAALAWLMAGAALAQAPALPAAAEPGAPASRIGPPVPAVRLGTTPLLTVPLPGSGAGLGTSQPSMSTDTSGMTVPPLKPASGTRG